MISGAKTATSDQQDDDDAAGERDLVALEARPGDPAERAALDGTGGSGEDRLGIGLLLAGG